MATERSLTTLAEYGCRVMIVSAERRETGAVSTTVQARSDARHRPVPEGVATCICCGMGSAAAACSGQAVCCAEGDGAADAVGGREVSPQTRTRAAQARSHATASRGRRRAHHEPVPAARPAPAGRKPRPSFEPRLGPRKVPCTMVVGGAGAGLGPRCRRRLRQQQQQQQPRSCVSMAPAIEVPLRTRSFPARVR
jgi:hypothetical protein